MVQFPEVSAEEGELLSGLTGDDLVALVRTADVIRAADVGDEVTLHYDSMLAKLLVHAPDRQQALARMARALDELAIVGVATNQGFHRRLMADAAFQAGFYVLNGPIEEAFFRGLVQGGLGIVLGAPVGFIVGTASYVLYHRLGWPWAETLATALAGIPLGLAFWLLPGPPSLLGVSIAHIAATCGFLGPGPYLLKKLGFV